MGKIQKAILPFVVLALTASEAFASGSGAEGHGAEGGVMHHLLWPTINFAIYVSILVYLVRRMVNPALKARAAEIETLLQRAHRDIAAAEEELKKREVRRAGIAQEQQLIRERLTQEGVRIAEDVKKNADFSAQDIRADVQKKVEQELKRASSEVRTLVVEGSSKRAREILKQSLSADDDRRLRQEAINGLFE